MKMIRSQLLHETLRQMREDEDAIEMARQEVINEFERGAEEFKRKDKKNKNSKKCKRCIQLHATDVPNFKAASNP